MTVGHVDTLHYPEGDGVVSRVHKPPAAGPDSDRVVAGVPFDRHSLDPAADPLELLNRDVELVGTDGDPGSPDRGRGAWGSVW
jgi:hypothetical protein